MPEVPHQAPAAGDVVAGLDELAARLDEHADTLDRAGEDHHSERERLAEQLATDEEQETNQ